MKRLVLTTDSSAAGAIQMAGLADLVIAIETRLVWGPLPSAAELDSYFAPRTTQGHHLHWLDDTPLWRREASDIRDASLNEVCAKHDVIELWIDPMPNAQLILLWLLDHWRAQELAAPKVVMCDVDFAVGSVEPQRIATLSPWADSLSPGDLELASLAWRAYGEPTPQPWFDLLKADFGRLPQLGPCMIQLLEELPGVATGLGATEARLLELVAAGDARPFDVFPGHEKRNERRVFFYWEVGALLDGLVRCPMPAVSGLDEGPFSLEMHNDAARHQRYKQSQLSLTEFGKAVLAGDEDFRRHNPIDRWWGGTHLTNDRLWRWDAETRSLVAPR